MKQKHILLFLFIPLIYVFGIFLISLFYGSSFNDVILYNFHERYHISYPIEYVMKPLVVSSGLLLITFFPGCLFAITFFNKRMKFSISRFLSLSFFLNILLLFAGSTLLKLVNITVGRNWLIGIILIEASMGIIAVYKKNFKIPINIGKYRKDLLYVILLIVIAIGFIYYLPNQIFYPLPVDFAYREAAMADVDWARVDDPQLEFGIATHFKKHILPYWHIRGLNKFGIYLEDPHLSYFLNFLTATIFGKSYASFNLLTLLFIVGACLFVYKIIGSSRNKIWQIFIYVASLLFFINILNLMMVAEIRPDVLPFSRPLQSLWDPIEGIWMFSMIGFIFFLLKRDSTFSFIFLFLATFARYEAIPYIFGMLIIYFFCMKENRKFALKLLKNYSGFIIIFSLYHFLLSVSTSGSSEPIRYLQFLIYEKLYVRFDNFDIGRLISFSNLNVERIWPYFSWENTKYFIRYTLIGSCYFSVLFLIPSKDKVTNFISIFGLFYFSSVVIQNLKLISYCFIFVLLSAISLRRFIYVSSKEKIFNLLLYAIVYFFAVFQFNLQ